MDRRESQMEAADPRNDFGSHAEIFVELRDQMAPIASEVLRKPSQIDMIRRSEASAIVTRSSMSQAALSVQSSVQ
jgi:hypothetical protein